MKPGSTIDNFSNFCDEPSAQTGGGSIALFLSLYLLLLAFFILLVGISQGENPKTAEIIEGLNSQFSSETVSKNPRVFSSDLGTFLSPAEFLDSTAKVYETAIPSAKIEVIKPGKIMGVSFHVNSLFAFKTDDLRPAQREAIAQIVSSLSLPPPGLRYEVEINFNFVRSKTPYPVVEDQAMRRAGIVARAYVEQGAPPRSVFASMQEGDPKVVQLFYYVVPDVEGQRQKDIKAALP